MKRRSVWLVIVMVALLLVTPAHADSLSDLLSSYGLAETEITALRALVKEMGEDVSEADIKALLTEFFGDLDAAKQQGTLAEGVYTHPAGFSLRVPEGWRMADEMLGMTVTLLGPVSEGVFMPTITVQALAGASADFASLTKEMLDEQMSKSLSNYRFIALDSFDFLDVPAREFVCNYGADDDSMLMQYQLLFNKDSKSFIITMTTLAEETLHDTTLDAYDQFLADFQVTVPGLG